ncbi:FecCD family ABC transporter permease [Syntrophaceticus schinkii]|jgi:iron complex transport system permease protein|uniref:ABC-type transporter, integral membrane subunit n=1 Tax=Syntrophaceticus schinkii TaxID=499207 RepID=A0A0B7MKQ0_9FIRM|nr:iron ABC transporter permease [Syntrophaceticus schinkii]MDD2361053.1 iron ABC transporter permease [Syntrophaceticus schinkii]MDD4262731.1 iron ABC transporter permease [Syntrophaceticus schinkii]CEO88738.1 ABC-type transporter, integral membrane subunit [Syntrophaceticus schinkii]
MNSHDSKINTVPFLFVLFGVLLILFLILNITLGSVKIPLGEIWESFMQRGDPVFQTVIMQIRFPRALAAVFGGAALAVSGLLLQIFFRNPIADPYVLGVSSGATLFVAIVTLTGCAIGIDSVSPFLLSSAALVGALGVVTLVVFLANKVKNVVTLLVVGLMIGFMCSAGTSFLIAFAEKEQVHSFVLWTLGSFSGFCWDQVVILAIGGGVFLAASYLLCKPLNALLLGEDYARSMGVNIKTLRFVIVMISSVLTALVTAFAGPVAFIGLAGPHLARLTLGTSDNKVLIPAAILIGALVTTLCDLVARLAFSPVELPISAVTSLFGAPIVIFLLLKRKTSL